MFTVNNLICIIGAFAIIAFIIVANAIRIVPE